MFLEQKAGPWREGTGWRTGRARAAAPLTQLPVRGSCWGWLYLQPPLLCWGDCPGVRCSLREPCRCRPCPRPHPGWRHNGWMLENLRWLQPVCLLPTPWAPGTIHPGRCSPCTGCRDALDAVPGTCTPSTWVLGRLALQVQHGESWGGGFCSVSAWSDSGEPRFLPSPRGWVWGNSPRGWIWADGARHRPWRAGCIVGALKAGGLPGAAQGRVPRPLQGGGVSAAGRGQMRSG